MRNTTSSACASELTALRAQLAAALERVSRLEDALTPAARRLSDALPATSSASPAGLMSAASLSAPCRWQEHKLSNLAALLPSAPGADMSHFDGRCSRRYRNFDRAWEACLAEPECTGVVKDNGLACKRSSKTNSGNAPAKFVYELRGGSMTRGPGTAWVCDDRIKARELEQSRPMVAAGAPANVISAAEGYVFIVLGSCSRPALDCLFLNEVESAISTLRKAEPAGSRRPIAIVTDGGVSAKGLLARLKPDLVSTIPAKMLHASSINSVNDVRVRKLLAYRHAPFERNVFFDGDTHVRSSAVGFMFDALKQFDLAAAFECCRLDWSAKTTPYDAKGFMRGWELQTGVMAFRRNVRIDAFWAEATREYEQRRGYWAQRSSGEQGAATLALARTDVRYMPLPPGFNGRPYTMFTYLTAFGLPVYHGKELWKGLDLADRQAPTEAIIAQRMLRDWDEYRDVLAAQFAERHLPNTTSELDSARRGWRKMGKRSPDARRAPSGGVRRGQRSDGSRRWRRVARGAVAM